MLRQLKILIRKEFRQIFRNKTILAIIFISPMFQLLLLPLAANYEIKNIHLALVDHDRSPLSRELQRTVTSSGYFQLTYFGDNYQEAYEVLEKADADLILEIPPHFERDLVREKSNSVFLGIDAINGTKAGLAATYLSQILVQFNQKTQVKLNPKTALAMQSSGVEVKTVLWFNKNYNYRLTLVPGILVLLITLVAGMLSALNIVAEKEIGTIEQINVTPVKKSNFILGKMIPFWVLGMIVFTLGLLVSRYVYGVYVQGNIWLLYFFVALFLVAILGYGLLISTVAETQQQAMFINFFFVMIFLLMCGLFTPIDSMPKWGQYLTYVNPLRYMVEAVRLIILKASTFTDLLTEFFALLSMAVVLNFLAIYNYRKTS